MNNRTKPLRLFYLGLETALRERLGATSAATRAPKALPSVTVAPSGGFWGLLVGVGRQITPTFEPCLGGVQMWV